MAIKAMSGITDEWYTPESQEGEEEPTRFKIRGLNGSQLLELGEFIDSDTGNISTAGLVAACKLGLKGWENVFDDEGEKVPFTRVNINRLPPEIIGELGGKVFTQSLLDEDERKN